MGINRHTVERKKFDSPQCRTNYYICSRFAVIVESLTLRAGKKVCGPEAAGEIYELRRCIL